jgi:preprotein translocase subunit YajC
VLGNTELTTLNQLAAEKSGSNPLFSLLPIILIGVVFYFLLFRPQRRRQQQQAQMQRQIQPGQRVMTTAGMLATVVAVEDDAVVLEIAPGVETRFVKQAVGQVLDDSADDDDLEDEDAEENTGEDAEEPEESTVRSAEESTRTGASPADRETLVDDVEAKTEPVPGATGTRAHDEPLTEGENNTGKRPPV